MSLPSKNILFLAVLSGVILGCASPREEFIGNRAQDECSESWPICSTVAGCILGVQSYVEGRFPGEAKFIVTIPEPSNVYVGVYLDNVTAAGTLTSIDWYEDSCSARIRESIEGQAFVAEALRSGYVIRRAGLVAVGDHLIEVRSDGEGDYVVKIDSIPSRLDQ